MTLDHFDLESHASGVLLPVRAHAGARRNAIDGLHGGMLKVSVTQAPEKGKANKAIAALLAASLGLRKSQVELAAGGTSPQKRFLIAGESIESLREKLQAALTSAR